MPDLCVLRVPSSSIGYGRMGLQVEAALRRLGVDVSVDQEDGTAGTLLLCSTPSHLTRYQAGQRLWLLSMWEAELLPEAFREQLHLFEGVIVPSEHNRELFSLYNDNVHYVPLGVDPTVWKPTRRSKPLTRFDFMIGGSGPRKGPDVAYKAFRMAFPDGSWGDGPEPWLTFKSPKGAPYTGQRIANVTGTISDAEEIALYERIHCYVQPSRGEGFGMQPLQSIVQACPTILTNAHGHASFAPHGIGIHAEFVPTESGTFMYGEAGCWWEPDVEEVAQAMRAVYDHYTDACDYAWEQAQLVHKTFTWDATAQRILDIIRPLPAYAGSGEWVRTEQKRYRTVLNRPHAAEIAGQTFQWQPFTDYWELADVKRILFEGGYLDPSCVGAADSGLTPEQLERAGKQSGSHQHCYACGQRLGSQPTAADDMPDDVELLVVP